MAGTKFVADMTPEDLHEMARFVAKETGFACHSAGGLRFEAKRGNLALSILFGAFIAYCDFTIEIEPFDDGAELVLTRNTPWWTGAIGVSRVKSWAKTLGDNLKKEVERSGYRVLKEKDF